MASWNLKKHGRTEVQVEQKFNLIERSRRRDMEMVTGYVDVCWFPAGDQTDVHELNYHQKLLESVIHAAASC